MWIRSATSKTCGMLWLMRMTGRPRVAKVADELEDLARFLDPECGRRLVEDDDLAPERGGPGDRDRLALAAGQRLDRLRDVLDRPDPEVLELLAGAPLHRSVVEHPQHAAERPRSPDLASEEHVRGDVEGGRKRRATGRRSRSRPRARPAAAGSWIGSPSIEDLPSVGDHRPRQALDEGRLARPRCRR